MTAGSDAFLRLLHAAELEHRHAPCLGWRRAVAHLVGGGHVDERLQLVVQIALGLLPMRRSSARSDARRCRSVMRPPARW